MKSMNEQTVRGVVQDELKKSQFKVGGVPYHTHNGIDSPTITTTSAPSSSATRAYRSTNQSITSGSAVKVQIDTATFTNGATFDSTNHRLTCLTAGDYVITGTVTFTAVSAGNTMHGYLYKNGSEYTHVIQGTTNNGTFSLAMADVVSLVVGDYIELFGQNQNSNCSFVGSASETFLAIASV